MNHRLLFSLICAFVLIAGIAGGCVKHADEIRFDYKWDYSENGPERCRLTMSDSSVMFYPQYADSDFVRIRPLSAPEYDSVQMLKARIVGDARQLKGAFQGKLTYERGSIEYSIIGINGEDETSDNSLEALSRYLLEKVGPLPTRFRDIFSLAAPGDSLYNDGNWSKLELKTMHPNSKEWIEHLVITQRNGAFFSQDYPQHNSECSYDRPTIDSLSEIIRHIDLNLEYAYWPGPYRGMEITGIPEMGISILIDGKPVATVFSLDGMPTAALQKLFSYMYSLSPTPLDIYYSCFDGESLPPTPELGDVRIKEI